MRAGLRIVNATQYYYVVLIVVLLCALAYRVLTTSPFGLTLRGITRPVTLALAPHGVITDVWGKTRLGLTATTHIQRSDFDVLKWGHVALAAGGFMVPDAVHVTLEIEAVSDEES